MQWKSRDGILQNNRNRKSTSISVHNATNNVRNGHPILGWVSQAVNAGRVLVNAISVIKVYQCPDYNVKSSY